MDTREEAEREIIFQIGSVFGFNKGKNDKKYIVKQIILNIKYIN